MKAVNTISDRTTSQLSEDPCNIQSLTHTHTHVKQHVDKQPDEHLTHTHAANEVNTGIITDAVCCGCDTCVPPPVSLWIGQLC